VNRQVPELVDHLFRHTSGRVVGSLVRRLGAEHLELVEDAVQEALLKALRLWPFRGAPEHPEAWIRRVAFNQALDALRREGRLRDRLPMLVEDDPHADPSLDPDRDLLALMLMCCHPAIPRDAQVALMLRTLAGFSVPEIACAFLAKEATIGQRLSRARRTIRERQLALDAPLDEEVEARLDAVLATLYLMFNEGYSLSSGDRLISADLCAEAIRLARLLANRPLTSRPEVEALLALMLLQAARLPARTSTDGALLTLAEQDRRLWDRRLIDEGLDALARSASGDRLSAFHLQAGIAACHAVAPDYDSTDWPAILDQYDALVRLSGSPLVALNRAVAVAMVHGDEVGLAALERIQPGGELESYPLYHVTVGELAARAGDRDQALRRYGRARALARTSPERALIERRLREYGGPAPIARSTTKIS
jgi:RNA polymerase sigma-70 factor (ECF subfamily)